jgi:nucleoside-diphosphate-sugar epimerase
MADDKAIGETYNLGFGITTKIIDLAHMMLKILNLEGKTQITTTASSWQGDIDTIWFNATKAKTELGWNPKIRLEDHLRALIVERKMI